MDQYDIRLIDKEDPMTPAGILKEIKKATSDASDKYETFIVTHDPINLKAKLALKKRASATQALSSEDEVIDEQFTDQDNDGIDL